MQRDGEMALGLPAIGFEPILTRLGEEEIDGFLVWFVDGRVFQEKAAPI